MNQTFVDIGTFFIIGLFIISLLFAIVMYIYVIFNIEMNNSRRYLQNDIEKNFVTDYDQFDRTDYGVNKKYNFSDYENKYW